MKYVAPSVNETAFNCPHCGALTTQFWHSLSARPIKTDSQKPNIVRDNDEVDWSFSEVESDTVRKKTVELAKNLKSGRPFIWETKDDNWYKLCFHNVNFAICYNCKEASLWIYDRLIYPVRGEAPPANPDLPADIRRDYEEASSILDLSPRGAAALIRLGIQKLCKELGQPGENINKDIAALVAAGLDVRVQKALDAVRVIGNNAVHPGTIDLRDDRATAESLFRLMNLIVEKMISEPKHVDEVYAALPEGARAQIERRDRSE